MRNQVLRAVLFSLLGAVALAATAPAASAQEPQNCLDCHGDKDSGAPFVDATVFAKSIHGKNLCTSCHLDAAKEFPHPDKLAPVSCANCHRIESQIYAESDHGRAVARGLPEAASCKDCHGHSHTLLNSRDEESPVNRKNLAATCANCHNDPKRMAPARLSERKPLESYALTVHGEAFVQGRLNAAVCSDCHGTHDLHGVANQASRVNRKNIPPTCGRCHQNVFVVYEASIHGQANTAGIKEAPVCTDCHGEHTIRSIKALNATVSEGSVSRVCSNCHAAERITTKFGLPADRLATYLESYHGLAAQRGDLRVANCASCHGFHDVLPSSDPRSAINKTNLAATCGRCHAGAGEQLATGFVHGPPSNKHWILSLVQTIYIFLIALTIGAMVLHNALDWLRKALDPAAARVAHGDEERLTRNERWQHALLLVTFAVLAYSGFALKFHNSGWAAVFAPFEEPVRKAIHRYTALVFCLLGGYHLAYMAGTRRGRRLVWSYLPRFRDATELFQRLAFNVWLRKTPPKPPEICGYGEKAEYWALVWGSLLMIGTGLLLVYNDFTLKHFPLWMSDLATMVHYYEAILACLALLVWHGYAVMFDPAVYPMNWAWITGRARWQDGHHQDESNPAGKTGE